MESADARTALLSIYLSRNARAHKSGNKSVPSSPHRTKGRRAGDTSRSQPGSDRFFGGGRTIYGVSEAYLTEGFGATWIVGKGGEGRAGWEAADEMFREYINIEQCSEEGIAML